MENKITIELAEKLSQGKSADEILAIARQNGLQISPEEANLAIEDMKNQGELTDEELEKAAGGRHWWSFEIICKHCGCRFLIYNLRQTCPECRKTPY